MRTTALRFTTGVAAPCAAGRFRKRARIPERVAAHSHADPTLLLDLLSPSRVVEAGYTALGRGLVANESVPKGTVLFGVDWCNVITVTDKPEETGNTYGQQALADWQVLHGELPALLVRFILSGGSSWFLRLMAWLLHLKAHGTGLWPLYIASLPKASKMACLMNFTPEERTELQDEELEALAKKEHMSILNLHETIFSSETGSLKELKLASDPVDTLWAASMVNSRCFSDQVGRERVSLMVPGADLANHQSEPNATYQLDAVSSMFTLRSRQAIAAGEEACISYLGSTPNKDNADLLKNYGFIIPGNVNDRVPFNSGHDVLSQLDPSPGAATADVALDGALLAEAAASLLVPAAAAADGSRSSGSSSGGDLNGRSLQTKDAAAAVAAVSSPGSQGSEARGRVQACVRSLQQFTKYSAEDVDLQMHLRGVAMLQQQCREMVARAPTSIDFDQELLAGKHGPMSPRMNAAVGMRLERKRLISMAMELLGEYERRLQLRVEQETACSSS